MTSILFFASWYPNPAQTFYVTVDLSSSSSSVRLRDKRGPPNSTANSPPIAEYDTAAASPIQGPTLNSSDAVQILDFHTSNPLISYQGRLYSSEWSTTLGTDLLLTPSRSSESPVLAVTRIKLSGRPVRMIRHHGASKPSLQTADEAAQTEQASVEPIPPQINSPIHRPNNDAAIQQPVLEIPLDKHASVARQNQVHFLERLSAIKTARGEQDEVTVYAKKRYTGTGWRSRIRLERDLDADEEGEGDDIMAIGEGDDDEDQNGSGKAGDQIGGAATYASNSPSRAARQKKPRSRGRGRSETAGLFRDYRPNAVKANGRDLIRRHGPGDGNPAPTESDSRAAGSVPTPQTWDELVPPRRESGADSFVVPDAALAIGPSSAAMEEGLGDQDETGDVLMEDV